MEIETTTEPLETVRILQTATCPSLSCKSTLTYNIGSDAEGEIQFQVVANDGGGFWNDDWVAQSEIQAVLDKQPKGNAITSATLRSLYPCKSTNSPGFLLAVLKNLGLVLPSKNNPRCYELGSPKAFMAEVAALLGTESELAMAATGNASEATDAAAPMKRRGRPRKV